MQRQWGSVLNVFQQAARHQDQGGVGIADVKAGALFAPTDGAFIKGVAPGDKAVFGQAALGRPAAAGHFRPKRRIQRRPIDAGLAAGYDFFKEGRYQSHPPFRVTQGGSRLLREAQGGSGRLRAAQAALRKSSIFSVAASISIFSITASSRARRSRADSKIWRSEND